MIEENGHYQVVFRPWEPEDAPDPETAETIQGKGTVFYTMKIGETVLILTEAEARSLQTQMGVAVR